MTSPAAPHPATPSDSAAAPTGATHRDASVSDTEQAHPAPTSGGCAHCDGSVPHKHVDVEAAVTSAQRALMGRVLVTATIVVLAFVAVGTLGERIAGYDADPPAGLPFTALGLAGWAIATVIGVALTYLGTRDGSLRGLVLGGALVAALAPITGWLAANLGGGSPWLALLAAAGWLLGSGVAHTISELRLRSMLREEGEAGETARQGAVHGRITRRPSLGWLWHPLGVAAWGALAAWLPLTLVVTVPLHIALTLAMAVRRVAR